LTLVGVMIVITLIAILAGFAIPKLLRCRIAANEAAAIGDLKADHAKGVPSLKARISRGPTLGNDNNHWGPHELNNPSAAGHSSVVLPLFLLGLQAVEVLFQLFEKVAVGHRSHEGLPLPVPIERQRLLVAAIP